MAKTALEIAQEKYKAGTLTDRERQGIIQSGKNIGVQATQEKLGMVGPEPELFGTAPKDLPKPTVATTESPIVPRGAIQQPIVAETGGRADTGDTDMRVTKIGEVLSDEEKKAIIDKERNKIRDMQDISFQERNKMFQDLQSQITTGELFGGETQLAAQRAAAEAQTSSIQNQANEARVKAEEIFRKQLDEETARIQAAGKKVLDTTQRLNSLRGAGRSSANEADIQAQTAQINELISVAQQNADLQLQKRQMEIDGAESDAISSINDALASNETLLNERISLAQQSQLALNNSIGADFGASMESMIGILEAGGEDVSGINQDKSARLGYFVNQDGSLYLNNAGNPVEFKTTLSANYTPDQIDAFAKGVSSGDLKFSDLNLDNADIALVMNAMNSKMDDVPGLAVNNIKAQRILKDIGLGTDEESVRTVTNLLKTYSESEVRNMIATDEFKNGAFVAGNQKLFDDLRKDADSFKSIERTFTGMNSIWQDFKNNPSESRAAMEQALIIMFNKMLDPGSVVREGEFDRTSQGQSAINAAEGWLQKLAAGGAGIKNEAFEDIVNIASVLYEASQDTVSDLKSSYKNFAGDLGADPDFVDRFFEKGFDLGTQIDSAGSIDDIYGSLTGSKNTPNQINSKSSDADIGGFLDGNFNMGDKTSETNDIENLLKSEEGYRDNAYLDSAGIPTIGYGFTSVNGKPVTMGQTITKQEAEAELQRQIARHSNYKKAVTVDLTPNQQKALASFEYNLGPYIWKTTGKDIIDAINRGDLQTAANIIKKHNKAKDPTTKQLVEIKGLTNRRNREVELLFS